MAWLGGVKSVSISTIVFPPLKKEDGKYVKNVTLRRIQKNMKNQYAMHETIFNFSKQFLTQIR